MLVPSLTMGGMERVCVNYANLLFSRGYDVTLLNLTSDSDMIVGKINSGIKYKKNVSQNVPNILKAGIGNILKGNFRTKHIEEWIKCADAKRLYKLLITDNTDKFDIEIAFYGGHMMKILSGSVQQKSLKIGWIHSPEIQTHYRLFRSENEAKAAYKSMDVLMCVSGTVKEKAIQLFGEDINAQVIYNPNDVALISQRAKEKIDNVSHEKFTFVNASRIDMYHKGFDRLIPAVKKLTDEGYDFDVWILGDGKDKTAFTNMIADYQLQKIIHYLGSKDNPYGYISNADCYICSSRYEGFSMVVAETLIIGTPIISTDISGAREMLGESEYGLIVENSEDGIYEGMKKILSDKEYFEYLKSQAQKRKDFLNEDNIMNQFESIIEKEM